MRRIALKPLDVRDALERPEERARLGELVAVADLRPDAKYVAALTCAEGISRTERVKALADLRAALPESCSVVVLPFGFELELFEDAPPDPPARRPRLGGE